MKKICVVGLGYIGLPTASLLATKGFQVLGVDTNENVVSTINGGKIHIVEPDLDVLVKSAIQNGSLGASTHVTAADVFIIAVPTPFKSNHVPDLAYVESAVSSVAPVLKPGNLLILESTIPVGTTEKVAQKLGELRPDLGDGIYLAHCPERVLPGNILTELVSNDRIVGGLNPASSQKAYDFYSTFVQGEIVKTDSKTAELSKLTENAFRDVNIAFANELSIICEKLEINVWELISLANRHPRVKILSPGTGVGGHCIAVDPWFIVDSVPEQSRLIRTAREVNNSKPHFVLDQVLTAARAAGPGAKIAFLGLSYKADVDDIRESPALEVVESAAKELKQDILVVEPYLKGLPKSLVHTGARKVELDEALNSAEVITVLVGHKQFNGLAPQHRERVAALRAKGRVIDPVGAWNGNGIVV